jgi:hypothetical protein
MEKCGTKRRLWTSVSPVTWSVLNADGASHHAATMTQVVIQYSGTTRITLRQRNCAGDTPRPLVETTMMKPLMTKKMSTPVAPPSHGNHWCAAGICSRAWCQTTISAAKARRYWIGSRRTDSEGLDVSGRIANIVAEPGWRYRAWPPRPASGT